MFRAIFSFQGRIGRLAFVGRMLAAFFVLAVVSFCFLMLGSLLSATFFAHDLVSRIFGIALALAAVLAGTWAAVALQARRIRDIGCNPMHWMIGLSVAMVADQWLLAPLTGMRFHPPLHEYTPVGGLLAFAYVLVLVFWPGVSEAESPEAADAAPPRPEPMPSLSAPSSALLLATPSQAAGRIQFGMPN